MNKIERAIVLAAGKGERLRPLTNNTPKPLILVNRVPIIETTIESLQKKGIKEIYIVVGYLKEKFVYLEKKYKGITLIENPYYEKCNNISSLYVARKHIKNSIILDGDQIVYNPDILSINFSKSCYLCSACYEQTNEWLLDIKDNTIINCKKGGNQGMRLYSVSKWSEEDGTKLSHDIENEFIRNRNTNVYWDDVPLFLCKDNYSLGVEIINNTDIIEIDDINDYMKAAHKDEKTKY